MTRNDDLRCLRRATKGTFVMDPWAVTQRGLKLLFYNPKCSLGT